MLAKALKKNAFVLIQSDEHAKVLTLVCLPTSYAMCFLTCLLGNVLETLQLENETKTYLSFYQIFDILCYISLKKLIILK